MEIAIEQKVKNIPSFELSYETSLPHRKVYQEEEGRGGVGAPSAPPEQLGLFIPKSKKYLVWFTFVEDQDVAILIELGRDKKPQQCKIMKGLVFDPNGPELAQGTILYGSLFYKTENMVYFIIEDLILHRSILMRKLCFGDKLAILERIFEKREITREFSGPEDGIQYAFTFPICFNGTHREPTAEEMAQVPYPIHHVQYRLFDRIVPYVNVIVQSRAGEIVHRNFRERPFGAVATVPPAPPRIGVRTGVKYQREPQGKERDIFIVRADLQSDLYILTHPIGTYEPDYAYIPNYRVSVFMNGLFRRIKENTNLDLIEESDDDEELMDTRADKFVDLNKEYRMECMYHKKFKRWIPLRIVYNNDVVTNRPLVENRQQYRPRNYQNSRPSSGYGHSHPQRNPHKYMSNR